MRTKRVPALILAFACLMLFSACDISSLHEPEKAVSEFGEKHESVAGEEYSETVIIGDSSVEPLFWRAESEEGNVIWLFGSIHVGTDDYYPLPDEVMEAYEGSDSLAVELNIITAQTDYAEMTQAIKHLLYSDGTKISDHISDELYERAKSLLESEGQYNSLYDMYKPTLWMSLISNLESDLAGLDPELGIDKYFLEQATDSGKTITEIESMTSQYAMLGGFSDRLQEMLLEDAVAAYEDGSSVDALADLAEAWGEGDEDYITSLLNFGDVSEMNRYEREYYKAMYSDRNLHMANFCELALQNGEAVFVVVGLAHFIGEDGIVSLLREKGYEVERVD